MLNSTLVTSQIIVGHISGIFRVGLKGVSKSRKFKWLVKVGANKGVTA